MCFSTKSVVSVAATSFGLAEIIAIRHEDANGCGFQLYLKNGLKVPVGVEFLKKYKSKSPLIKEALRNYKNG